jgi:hypothetical protein
VRVFWTVTVIVLLLVFGVLVALQSGIVQFRTTVKYVGPSMENEAYNIMRDGATQEILDAVKRDMKGSMEFHFQGVTLLGWAVNDQRTDVVKGLLKMGFSPNSPGACPPRDFNPPLNIAVVLNYHELIDLLLENGADPTLMGPSPGIGAGDNAFGYAKWSDDPWVKERFAKLAETRPTAAAATPSTQN